MANFVDQQLSEAKQLMEDGKFATALKKLLPLAGEKDAESLFLLSTFSVGESETEEEFEARSFRMLKESAELGFPKAIHALAMCYEHGDLVERDKLLADYWLKKASDHGYVSP
jgi:TPR repeat protein